MDRVGVEEEVREKGYLKPVMGLSRGVVRVKMEKVMVEETTIFTTALSKPGTEPRPGLGHK